MKRIAFIILIFNIALSYELTTFSEMTFPLGMNSDGTIIVGSNLNNQAVIWTASDGTTIVGDGEFWGVSEDGESLALLLTVLVKKRLLFGKME